MSGKQLCRLIEDKLGRSPFHLPADGDIEQLVWCTGAAEGQIEAAAALGAQAYISGEVSEQTYHLAQELGIHYFSAGHHATERFGARSLGGHLAQTFEMEHQFFDENNPV